MTLEDEMPRLAGVQYATGKEQRAIANTTRKNEQAGPKQKWCSVVDVSSGESKISCYKEQYCIGTWVLGPWIKVNKEMAILKINSLGLSELKWMGIGEYNSDDHYIYSCGQESLRRYGVALIVNKRIWNVVLGWNLKNDRMISVCFQGKPFSIKVIQV